MCLTTVLDSTGHFGDKDTIQVNMGNPESSKQLMMHIGSPALRQKIFSAAYAVEPRHAYTFDELMKNRLDLAKLVGYPSWGHKVLEHGMVQEPEMVADFLKHLRVRLQPHLKEEVVSTVLYTPCRHLAVQLAAAAGGVLGVGSSPVRTRKS